MHIKFDHIFGFKTYSYNFANNNRNLMKFNSFYAEFHMESNATFRSLLSSAINEICNII